MIENASSVALHRLVLQGSIDELVEVLLNGEVDVNSVNNVGSTSLHLAAMLNDVETIKLLLKFGADVEAQNREGWTALHVASQKDAYEAAAVLLNQGAETDVTDAAGRTPVFFANARVAELFCSSRRPK
ncbi:MAG: ankyrin repeat domain-containing protein [Gemmatimonadetes bacterium]|nr:ankyrin repeat domain-containing protein [Gemmatimonadota bacterium]